MLSNMLMLMGKQVYSLCETRDHRTTVNEIISEEGETFFPQCDICVGGKTHRLRHVPG